MNSQRPVVNISGDNPETILHLAKKLGTARLRRDVFDLIYGKGERPRSKKQIAQILGRPDEQVVQDALEYLAKHHLVARSENAGRVDDRSKWLYGKETTVRAHRHEIVKYADNPAAAKRVHTKRQPRIDASFSLVKPARRSATAPRARQAPRKRHARLRIALLVTNPDRRASLQTAIEARDIEEGIRLGGRAGEVDLKLVLAPTLNTLLDMLNSYDPGVIHFSGHGGGQTLLFDNEHAGDDGGTVLDFDMVARVVAATSVKPKLLVLAACDTVEGAERFLDVVPAVIAMADSIADDAACDFSKRFYQSLSAGQTIENSLTQAKLLLEHKGYKDADLPTLVTRDTGTRQYKFL